MNGCLLLSIQVTFTVRDALNALNKPELGRAIGPGGVSMEAMMCGVDKLLTSICFLLNIFGMHFLLAFFYELFDSSSY